MSQAPCRYYLPPEWAPQSGVMLTWPHAYGDWSSRLATVEPVFANLRHNKGLDRFTLRGRRKVEAQWRLYCLVHNIEKLMKARQEQ